MCSACGGPSTRLFVVNETVATVPSRRTTALPLPFTRFVGTGVSPPEIRRPEGALGSAPVADGVLDPVEEPEDSRITTAAAQDKTAIAPATGQRRGGSHGSSIGRPPAGAWCAWRAGGGATIGGPESGARPGPSAVGRSARSSTKTSSPRVLRLPLPVAPTSWPA